MSRHRLDGILKLRRWREEGIQGELAAARLRADEMRLAAVALAGCLSEAERDLGRRLSDGGLTQHDAHLLYEYRDRLKRELIQAEETHRTADQECKKIERRLMKAAKDRRVVERVCERTDSAESLVRVRAEQRSADEGASLRYARDD